VSGLYIANLLCW